jgi:hypothetical protein
MSFVVFISLYELLKWSGKIVVEHTFNKDYIKDIANNSFLPLDKILH